MTRRAVWVPRGDANHNVSISPMGAAVPIELAVERSPSRPNEKRGALLSKCFPSALVMYEHDGSNLLPELTKRGSVEEGRMPTGLLPELAPIRRVFSPKVATLGMDD